MTHQDMEHQHHGIDYIEFTVVDLSASKSFYEASFGWTFTDYGPGYAGIRSAGREIGGLSQGASGGGRGRGGGPLVVLYSDDLEKTLASVRKNGGTIVKEPFSFPGGQRFHFHDPSGNELAVWSPA